MSKKKKTLLHLLLTLGLVALGVAGMFKLTASKPEIKKRKPPVALPLVKTVKIKTGPQSVHIFGEGTVRPLKEIDLVPQVGGKVIYVSPALIDGGQFEKGETLLRIDPVDYQLAVTLARAKVKDAESHLQLAREEAAAAREEWRLLYNGKSGGNTEPPALVAKEPQLAAAKAQLEADKADLRKAQLNLERTELKAPFEGRVSREDVDIGQYVSIGQSLATLYSTEATEIVVPLEDKSLYWFHVPGFTPGEGPGAQAMVETSFGGREQTWLGEVVRAEGKLDERTRMVNVVVRVDKPYSRKPPLVVGLFVKVKIKGRILPEVAIIPRAALRPDDFVWVVDKDSRLRFRKVNVACIQGDEVFVGSGLEDEEMIVISPLKAVTDGMGVRTSLIGDEDE